jgi:hypothetical protein
MTPQALSVAKVRSAVALGVIRRPDTASPERSEGAKRRSAGGGAPAPWK